MLNIKQNENFQESVFKKLSITSFYNYSKKLVTECLMSPNFHIIFVFLYCLGQQPYPNKVFNG